jgi:hypothetical protein
MDTLGFSFFMALTRKQAGNDAILILDDIFTSVDDQHLERICQLIADEATTYRQIIMTTHSRKIFDWVRVGKLPQNVYRAVELSSRWSLNDGIRARASSVNRQEVEDLLAKEFLDRDVLAVKTRRYMEAILGDMVIDLGASGRMKRYGDYELSDYLGALRSLSKEGWQVVSCKQDAATLNEADPHAGYNLRQKAKDFNDDKNVVNKLIHYAEEGASYTDEEARRFAAEVLELDKYLRCEKCGSLVGINKKHRTCQCGRYKLETRPNQAVRI